MHHPRKRGVPPQHYSKDEYQEEHHHQAFAQTLKHARKPTRSCKAPRWALSLCLERDDLFAHPPRALTCLPLSPVELRLPLSLWRHPKAGARLLVILPNLFNGNKAGWNRALSAAVKQKQMKGFDGHPPEPVSSLR